MLLLSEHPGCSAAAAATAAAAAAAVAATAPFDEIYSQTPHVKSGSIDRSFSELS